MSLERYEDFFRVASGGVTPYPYQQRLALESPWPSRIEVPTGLGKTLAVLSAWLWRRSRPETRSVTPRRLVYCLPMRVLVEQTRDVAKGVVERLGSRAKVVVLMGGVEDSGDWDTQPEADAIVIGTQDMLLSRALQRGYGMSRYRWPLHFGLLNNDCLWVIDEVQLVGSGVATSAQLQAFRRKLGTARPVRTSWMSATLEESWLRTVDVSDEDLAGRLALDDSDRARDEVRKRVGAKKSLARSGAVVGDAKAIASEVLEAHRPGTRTLVIANTVQRAKEIHAQLRTSRAALVLLHSRFRQPDRAEALAAALADPGAAGTIVVSTQVIEAGVDLTSAVLMTEVAPWAALVQRFGRCNRGGNDQDARVLWVPLPEDEKARRKLAAPYSTDELLESQDVLSSLSDVGPSALPKRSMRLERGPVLRRRDLLDLFDTTPDLLGDDVDVSRFIRDADEHDCRVYWRDFEDEPSETDRRPSRDELCAAPAGEMDDWIKKKPAWVWSALDGRWERAKRARVGMTLLLRSRDGGYVRGLDLGSTATVAPLASPAVPTKHQDDAYDEEPESEWRHWYLLSSHSRDVSREAARLARALELGDSLAEALALAGRWHDAGKAHEAWQLAAKSLGADPPTELVAKSRNEKGKLRPRRRGFRHELASALLALAHRQSDLVVFLIASHHGKVRLSLRALPNEPAPNDERGRPLPDRPHARGVWEGDTLPEIDLGDGTIIPPTILSLRYMSLGMDENTGPSWASRVLALRDDPTLGPFRLGFLEALIKCADERASVAAQEALR